MKAPTIPPLIGMGAAIFSRRVKELMPGTKNRSVLTNEKAAPVIQSLKEEGWVQDGFAPAFRSGAGMANHSWMDKYAEDGRVRMSKAGASVYVGKVVVYYRTLLGRINSPPRRRDRRGFAGC